MKKWYPLFLLLFVTSCSSSIKCDTNKQNGCIKILFLGNSYTYVNDLPFVLSSLAKSGGHLLETGISAGGGWTLLDHANNPKTIQLIQDNDWTYVVLQEQSEIPAVESSRLVSMYPAIRILTETIRQSHAIPLLFVTWAHRDGIKE
jgi:hypothetical protein